ncbi:MAG: hypothetical protein WCO56_28895 [Verrucomicrobiota bacterium]
MPFDPNKPVDNSLAEAGELRDQFNALKALDDDKSARIAALEAQVAALQASVVTTTQLAEALSNLSAALIANSSANSNGVMPMDFVVSDPPTQWETGTIYNTLNALIQALRRQ